MRRYKIFFIILCIILTGYLIPQRVAIPVKGASPRDWHPKSFWYYPWGKSITHKGVDIFAKEGTSVISATPGLVVYTGDMGRGGKVVLVLSSKWRIHYYAHLKEFKTSPLHFVNTGESVGTVGTTGNAEGKEPHLHYSIFSIIPLPWRIDSSIQGWLKMFFLNPIELMKEK
ncbi:M23 family metallopeptidase [Rhodocytophaga rosea]|uniref:M23 family metallopeptidase n=1 Tax=Rhodocytophaga rosea TaxID=2704465 RepID=A0A6C0GUG9_9BACT|nr:M23 family metallopeptidase [Rhodocytophaga rosea]